MLCCCCTAQHGGLASDWRPHPPHGTWGVCAEVEALGETKSLLVVESQGGLERLQARLASPLPSLLRSKSLSTARLARNVAKALAVHTLATLHDVPLLLTLGVTCPFARFAVHVAHALADLAILPGARGRSPTPAPRGFIRALLAAPSKQSRGRRATCNHRAPDLGEAPLRPRGEAPARRRAGRREHRGRVVDVAIDVEFHPHRMREDWNDRGRHNSGERAGMEVGRCAARCPLRASHHARPGRRQRGAQRAVAVRCGMPVLKEWGGLCDSLADGTKTLLMRKGGVLEGKGFALRSSRFLLLPTTFHESKRRGAGIDEDGYEETESRAVEGQGEVSFNVAAEVTGHWMISGSEVAMGSLLTALGEETVMDRIGWRPELPLHLIEVRAHRLKDTLCVEGTDKFGGCTSWAEVDATELGVAVEGGKGQAEEAVDALWNQVTAGAEVALDDAAFMSRRGQVRATLWRIIDETLWDAPPGLSVVDCAAKYKEQ